MANVGAVTRFFSEFTPTTWSAIVLIAMVAVAIVKVWPLIKAKINEARKIELDAEADLRGDLLGRIKDLEEAQHKDRVEFYDAMVVERRRCDDELDAIRLRLKGAEDANAGLQRMIAQNSQSTGFLLDQKAPLGGRRRKKDDEK